MTNTYHRKDLSRPLLPASRVSNNADVTLVFLWSGKRIYPRWYPGGTTGSREGGHSCCRNGKINDGDYFQESLQRLSLVAVSFMNSQAIHRTMQANSKWIQLGSPLEPTFDVRDFRLVAQRTSLKRKGPLAGRQVSCTMDHSGTGYCGRPGL